MLVIRMRNMLYMLFLLVGLRAGEMEIECV